MAVAQNERDGGVECKMRRVPNEGEGGRGEGGVKNDGKGEERETYMVLVSEENGSASENGIGCGGVGCGCGSCEAGFCCGSGEGSSIGFSRELRAEGFLLCHSCLK
jgi:hypothetical protein